MPQHNFQFDENGYLVSRTPIDSDLTNLRFFVASFPPNDSQHWIFDNYLRYLDRFRKDVFPWFEQWVDGSFVSQKKNPRDIDVVTFIDYRVFELRGENKLSQFLGDAVDSQGIDAYIVKVYPDNHEKHGRFLFDQSLWDKRFSQSKTLHAKGYLKLTFQNIAS